MITVREIKKIFESPEYRHDLSELSSYAESIQHERPMVWLFGKYLYLQGHEPVLEGRKPATNGGKHDLVVDGTSIEFKVHYDWHIDRYLRKELDRYESDSRLWEALQAKEITTNWNVTPGIYKDVFEKKADIFVWVICQRNLKGLTDDHLPRICSSTSQQRYNKGKGYDSSDFLKSVELLLEKIGKLRRFSREEVEILTNGRFPSKYHMKLCEFECNH